MATRFGFDAIDLAISKGECFGGYRPIGVCLECIVDKECKERTPDKYNETNCTTCEKNEKG